MMPVNSAELVRPCSQPRNAGHGICANQAGSTPANCRTNGTMAISASDGSAPHRQALCMRRWFRLSMNTLACWRADVFESAVAPGSVAGRVAVPVAMSVADSVAD